MNSATVLESGALFCDAPEDAYNATVAESHRKAWGQFFTPAPVAEFMARWVTASPSCRAILDPAFGLGAFYRAVTQIAPARHYQFTGYDLDPRILREAERVFPSGNGLKLHNEDYLANGWQQQYDGIIGNPPYFKFQDYKNRRASLDELQNRLGLNLSGFTNIYTMFMVKALSQLAENGRAAFLVPFEFLNADYGVHIKKHLLENRALRYVILFSHAEAVFANALTTSCLLLFANDKASETVTFLEAQAVSDLPDLADKLTAYPNAKTGGNTLPYNELNPAVKWRAYYQKQPRQHFKNLVLFTHYAKAVRGIATGDNDFFTFNEQKQAEFGIADEFLLPCLTKAAQAPNNFYTPEDFAQARAKGSRVLLFDAARAVDTHVRRYLERGEQLGVHERYLTRHRKPWHTLEHRPPAPILVNVFNRKGLRFVRNEAMVRNLTCFHAVYLNLFAAERADLLMAYLLTDIAQEVFNINRREYGGGLNKFEPNDLNISQVIDLNVIDIEQEQFIGIKYTEYRESALAGRPDARPLRLLNAVFSRLIGR